MNLTEYGYLDALEDLGAFWAGEIEVADLGLAAVIAADETGLVNPRPEFED